MYEITVKKMEPKTVPGIPFSTQINTEGVVTTIFSETVEITGVNASKPIENIVIKESHV